MDAQAGLAVHGVTKRYGETLAVDDMSFGLAHGEVFGFVGSNGAGKSTMMRIILGVLAADAGQVSWQGIPLTPPIRRRIGYMPEERGLYPRMKVAEQLVYLARLHGLTVEAAAAATDAWLERLEIARHRDDDVQKLSLGNQQRVQLAAALVHDPVLLVLDEPFAGLDPIAVDVMSQVLRDKASDGIPVIFSSHQLDLVEQLCHRVGIVRRGRMVACGSVTELRAGSPTQVVVDAPDAPSGWADDLPGVTVRSAHGTITTVELGAEADDQLLLRAALATGAVRSFSPKLPSLSDLFRHVVAEERAA